ncbi:MAG: hypothetical protein OEZ65_00165 [Gemmatimonadota bacterium]|nr:hypothetical protein [Gemmatimonadota bacterium]MDH5757966.1 hypothetical protein [Gemmatimonadota bacterium]
MTVATRGVTFRDFTIFQFKLVLDGLKDVLVFNLSIVAVVVDFFMGRGKRPRFFYSVLRMSERLDLWLNLHSVVEGLDHTEDGLFGASKAGTATMLGQIEQIVRGGDDPRTRRSREA